MQLPILAYGHDILRKQCGETYASCPDLDKLIDNMWETMYGANGCGLAAPRVAEGRRRGLHYSVGKQLMPGKD